MLGSPEHHTFFGNSHKPHSIPQKSRSTALYKIIQPYRPCACRILRYIGIFHTSRHSWHKRRIQCGKSYRHDFRLHYCMALAETQLLGSPLSHGKNAAEKLPESRPAFHKIHERQKKHHLPSRHYLYPACTKRGRTALCRDTLHDRFYAVYRHFQQRG